MIKTYSVPDGTMSAVFKEGDTVVLIASNTITDYLVYLIETNGSQLLRRVKKDKGGLILRDSAGQQQRIKEPEITGIWEVAGTINEAEDIPEHHHYIELSGNPW